MAAVVAAQFVRSLFSSSSSTVSSTLFSSSSSKLIFTSGIRSRFLTWEGVILRYREYLRGEVVIRMLRT